MIISARETHAAGALQAVPDIAGTEVNLESTATGKGNFFPETWRAEMWMKSEDWLADPVGAQIPDSDALQADACGPGYGYDSNTRLLLEKKDDMRRRGAAGPDQWDAVALTFAEPVADRIAGWSRRLVYPDPGVA